MLYTDYYNQVTVPVVISESPLHLITGVLDEFAQTVY